MAFVRLLDDICVIGAAGKLFTFNINYGRESGECWLSDEKVCDGFEPDPKPPAEDQQKAPPPSVEEECGVQTYALGVSHSETPLVAVCNNRKQLIVKDIPGLTTIFRRSLSKQATCVLFKRGVGDSGEAVLVGDRSGNVTQFDLGVANSGESRDDDGRLLLGHNSMLLDMAFSPDGRYLITCDRDGKIRVSHYPNTYNIERYCLGHTAYVRSLAFMEDSSLGDSPRLLSLSGDGVVKMWDYLSGKCLLTILCPTSSPTDVGKLSVYGPHLYASFPGRPSIIVNVKEIVERREAAESKESPPTEPSERVWDVAVCQVASGWLELNSAKMTLQPIPDSAIHQPRPVTGVTTQLSQALKSVRDEMPSLHKNVAFGNVDSYLKRKLDKTSTKMTPPDTPTPAQKQIKT